MEKTQSYKNYAGKWSFKPFSAIFLVMLVFCIAQVSAFDFDNVKEFDPDVPIKGKIEIKDCDFWLLGCITIGDKIAEYHLTKNTDECLINCEAEGKAILYEEGVLFEEWDFKNKLGNKIDLSSFKIYLQINESYEETENIYNETCGYGGRYDCLTEIIGNKTITKYRIKEELYEGEIKEAGNYSWKIKAIKKPNEKIDWAFSAFGIETDEIREHWAWWNNNWNYKKQLNITGGSVTLYNFTAFVKVSNESNMMANYSDLRFLDSTESFEYNYTIDYYNSTEAGIWIGFPTFSTGTNTLYMYYGNSNASDVTSGTDTFINADLIYNLQNQDGTNEVGAAGSVSGTLNQITGVFGNASECASGGSIETNVNMVANDEATLIAWAKDSTAAGGDILSSWVSSNMEWWYGASNRTSFKRSVTTTASYDMNGGVWTHLSVIKNSSHALTLYNGTQSGSAANANSFSATELALCAYSVGNPTCTDCKFDEVRYYPEQKTKEWLVRDWQNSDPSYYVFGAEESILSINTYLISPANNTQSNISSQFLSCNASVIGISLDSISLYLFNSSDDIIHINTTEVTGTFNITNYSYSFSDGIFLWNCFSNDTTNVYSDWGINRTITIDTTPPSMTIISPLNQTYLINSILVNVSVSDAVSGIDTIKVWNGTDNITYTTPVNFTFAQGSTTLIAWANDTLGNSVSDNVTFFIDSLIPTIDFTAPTESNGSSLSRTNIQINVTATDSNLKNITIRLFDVSNVQINISNSSTSPLFVNFTGLSDGQYYFNATAYDNYGNSNSTETREILIDTGAPAITATSPTGIHYYPPSNVSLNYSVVDSSTDSCWASQDGGATNFSLPGCNDTSIEIPRLGNISVMIWANDSAGNVGNTSIDYYAMPTIAFCNATTSTPFLNITFKDEETNAFMNATITSSNWIYWFDDVRINRSYSYDTSANYSNYSFCISPAFGNATLDLEMNYLNSGYPSKRYDLLSETFTNSTNHTTLYLLHEDDGIYTTFQVTNQADQPIGDVYATAERQFTGVWTLIGAGSTDDAGGVTFFVNPDISHRFTFSKSGYTTYIVTLTPTQSSYTIKLGSEANASEFDYSRGIAYLINPIANYLNNHTTYQFNLSISSSYWALEEYGFVLKNESGTELGKINGTNETGGIINLAQNTSNYEEILMDFYWVINGTYSNLSRAWLVYDLSDTSFSIAHFFSDLSLYMDAGMFGIDAFGKALLSFVLIFMITGFVSFKVGIEGKESVAMGLVFSLTWLFDVGFGLIPNPPLAAAAGVNNFATIFIGFIVTGLIIKEAIR